MAAHKDFTSARLEKLQRLNTLLSDQWRRMAAAWFAHPVPDPISNEEAEILRELGEIVGATGKAVGGVLTASQQFISGKLGETLPEPCPGLLPTIQVARRWFGLLQRRRWWRQKGRQGHVFERRRRCGSKSFNGSPGLHFHLTDILIFEAWATPLMHFLLVRRGLLLLCIFCWLGVGYPSYAIFVG